MTTKTTMATTTTISAYRSCITGETAPPHRLGVNEDGENLYQAVEGWEPIEPYRADAEGNWIPLPADLVAAIETEAKADAALFVEEFGEALDPAATDWDSEAWYMSESIRSARAAGLVEECWPVYQRALVAETERLVEPEPLEVTRYRIEARHAADCTCPGTLGAHEWRGDVVGDHNEFASEAEAEAAIESLRALGREWADAEYRVVEV